MACLPSCSGSTPSSLSLPATALPMSLERTMLSSPPPLATCYSVMDDLKQASDLEKDSLGLGHSFSRAKKVKFNVNR